MTLLLLTLACTGDTTTADSGTTDSGTPDTWPAEGQWRDDCPTETAELRSVQLTDLALNVACRGAGPTILFLHGFPEWWYSWNAVMDQLVESYRLVAPDQRGYNTSDKPEDLSAYELAELIEDIGELVPEIADGPVVLVGHDWGGPVAWGAAHTYPELFRGFVGANAPHPNIWVDLALNDPDQAAASAYMALFRSEQAESILSANDFGTLVGIFEDALSEEDIPLYKEAWGQEGALTGGLNWYRANNIDDPDSLARFQALEATVEIPTRVLWGLDDSALLPQNLDGLDQYVSDLEIVEYEGVDHWIEHRIPEEVAAQIRDFEQGLDP
jgi:epoxide hydrolase 4